MAKARPIFRDNPPNGRSVRVERRVEDETGCAPRPDAVTHSHATLAFYTGGRSKMEINGEWTLRTGDVLLIPAGEPHRMLERERPQFWGMSFCVPCFAANGNAALLEPFDRVRNGGAAVVHIPEERREFLEQLFRELAAIGDTGPSHLFDAVERSLVTLILAEIDRATRAGAPSGGGGVVVEALRFIERNCLGKLTLNEVAAAVGKSPAYVTSALTEATGRSAVQWIVGGRMAEARRLLLHSDEPIDIISERVGYGDSTHFIRMFRREHGATPAAWRTRMRAPSPDRG